MIELIADNNSALTIAPDDSSAFSKWILDYLKEPKELTRFEINAIATNFYEKEHDNCIFRGEILDWLLNIEGRTIYATNSY